MADGNVLIRMLVDTKGVNSSVKSAESAFSNLSKAIKNAMGHAEPKELEASLGRVRKAISDTEQELKALANIKLDRKDSLKAWQGQFKEASAALKKEIAELEKEQAKLEKLQSGSKYGTAGRLNAEKIKETQSNIKERQDNIAYINGKIDQAEKEIARLNGELKQNAEATSTAKESLKQYKGECSTLQGELKQAASASDKVSAAFKRISVAAVAAYLGKTLVSAVGRTINILEKLGSVILKLNISAVKGAVKGLGVAFNGVRAAITGIQAKGQELYAKTIAPIASMFKSVLKRKLRSMILQLVNSVTSGLGKIAKVSKEVNQAMTSFTSSTNYIKDSLAAMVAPVVSIAAKAFSYLADAIVDAMNAVGRFLAMITGQNSYIVATRQTQDYAASLESASSSASKLKRELMGFDEINKLSDDSDKTSTTTNPFSTQQIGQDWLTAFQNSDFTAFGANFARRVADALTSIDWDTLKEKQEKLSDSIVTWVNGALSVDNLATAFGETIGKAINLYLTYGNDVSYHIDFNLFGRRIAEMLNSAVDTLDESTVAEALWNATDTMLGILTGFFSEIEVEKIYFKFKNISYRTYELARTATKDIPNSIMTAWNNNSEKFAKQLGEDIGKAINKCVDFITIVLGATEDGKTIGSILQEALVTCIGTINAETLGSTIGGIISGCFSNVVDFLSLSEDDKKTIKDKIVTLVKSALNSIESKDISLSDLGDAIIGALELAIDITDDLVKSKEVAKVIGDVIDFVVTYVPQFITGLLTLASTLWNAIADAIKNYMSDPAKRLELWNGIKSVLEALWNNKELVLSLATLSIAASAIKILGTAAALSFLGKSIGGSIASAGATAAGASAIGTSLGAAGALSLGKVALAAGTIYLSWKLARWITDQLLDPNTKLGSWAKEFSESMTKIAHDFTDWITREIRNKGGSEVKYANAQEFIDADPNNEKTLRADIIKYGWETAYKLHGIDPSSYEGDDKGAYEYADVGEYLRKGVITQYDSKGNKTKETTAAEHMAELVEKYGWEEAYRQIGIDPSSHKDGEEYKDLSINPKTGEEYDYEDAEDFIKYNSVLIHNPYGGAAEGAVETGEEYLERLIAEMGWEAAYELLGINPTSYKDNTGTDTTQDPNDIPDTIEQQLIERGTPELVNEVIEEAKEDLSDIFTENGDNDPIINPDDIPMHELKPIIEETVRQSPHLFEPVTADDGSTIYDGLVKQVNDALTNANIFGLTEEALTTGDETLANALAYLEEAANAIEDGDFETALEKFAEYSAKLSEYLEYTETPSDIVQYKGRRDAVPNGLPNGVYPVAYNDGAYAPVDIKRGTPEVLVPTSIGQNSTVAEDIQNGVVTLMREVFDGLSMESDEYYNMHKALIKGQNAINDNDIDAAKKAYEEFTEYYQEFIEAVSGTDQNGTNVYDWLAGSAQKAWYKIKSLFGSNGKISITTEEGIGAIFNQITTKFTDNLKSAINSPIDNMNLALNTIRDFKYGDKTPFQNIPSIPRLAQGAVIPANKEFLAVLGDQKQGTNIEAPLDTIVDAVMIALNNGGMSADAIGNAVRQGMSGLSLKVDRITLGQVTADAINQNRAAAGKLALNL